MSSHLRILRSLRYPAFRLLWLSMLLTSLCAQMQNPLLAWIVLDLTESSFLYSVIMSLRFAPYLLGPMAGVVADRIDRKRLLLVFKAVQIVSALVLGSLVLGRQIELWHVTVIILLQSVTQTFHFPAQSAFIADVVRKEEITNAIALQRISMSISGLIGPSLVGAFVNHIGIGTFYHVNSIIYLVAACFLWMIRKPPISSHATETSMIRNLGEAFRYSWRNKPVFGGIVIYFITNLFPIATNRTLLWVFAKNVLRADASGLGWLAMGRQLGSVLVTLLVAQLGHVKRKGRIIVLASLVWGGMWIFVATSTAFYITFLILTLMSVTSTLTMMLAQIVLLLNTDSEMRGRIMGIRTLAISSQFPGSILAGILAENWGEPLAVGFEGCVFIASMMLLVIIVPSLRQTE